MRLTFFIGALVLVSSFACGKQQQGERCDPNSGNLDCDTGLICRTADQLSIVGRGVALCCPPDDVTPSENACRAGAELPGEELPAEELPSPGPLLDASAGDGGL